MGGVGDFGLVIQINRGQTGRCRTYNNPPLTPDPAGILFRLKSRSLEWYHSFSRLNPAGSLLITNFFGLIMSNDHWGQLHIQHQ
jgi:hypothetical protein